MSNTPVSHEKPDVSLPESTGPESFLRAQG